LTYACGAAQPDWRDYPANGYREVYDEVGRVVRKERLANVVIDLVDDDFNLGFFKSVFVSGTVLASGQRSYDAAGRLLESIEPDGMVTRYEYYNDGRQKAVIVDALGLAIRTEHHYDAARREVRTTDPLGHDTRYQYDDAGRLLKTIYVDGLFTQNTYDELGRVVAERDRAGNVTNYEYDVAGQRTAVIMSLVADPENSGQMTRPRYEYVYDKYRNLQTVKDPKGYVTRFTYDSQGRQLTVRLPGGQVESQAYNTKSQQIRGTDANGQVTEFLYDSQNRVQTKNLYAAGATLPTKTVTYEYDDLSRVKKIIEPGRTTEFTYDLNNRLTRVTSPEGTIGYEYDEVRKLLTRTYTGDVNNPTSDIRYSYDAVGRMKTVTVLKQSGQSVPTNLQTVTYVYDAVNLRSVVRPNGVTTDYTYDQLDRLTNVVTNGPVGLIASVHYTLDATGHRMRADENNGGIIRTVDYTYDGAYRLTSETIDNGARAITYKYDLAGNRLERNDSAEGITTYFYDVNDRLLTETLGNQLTSYGYDSNGAVIDMMRTVDGVQTQHVKYSYDLEKRLVGIDTDANGSNEITYLYDDNGNRVGKIEGGVQTLYLVDSNNPSELSQVIEEKTAGGAINVSYVYGREILSQMRAGQMTFYVADGLGSIRALTDSTGAVTDR